jgi:hypothetical protein
MKKSLKVIYNINLILLLGAFLLNSNQVRSSEFLIFDGQITWNEDAKSAFYMFMPDASMPANWLYPNDYYNGMIYTRYEILSVATKTPCGMQFGIFQWHPNAKQQDFCGELCEKIRWLNNGVGSVAENGSSPSTWWKAYGGVDFSRMGDIQSLCPTIWCNDPVWPVGKPGQGGDDAGIAWSKRFNWFPITLRVTIVAVSAGSAFSGWSNYIQSTHDESQEKPTYIISPNPSYNGVFNIQTDINLPYSLEIISLEGKIRKVISGKGTEDLQINLQDIPKGMYFFRITARNFMMVQKAILE